MGSLRLTYDAEGDILDVDFRLIGERPQRGIELHDNIVVWTDAEETQILRLTLLSYSQLCAQPQLTLTRLRRMPVQRRARLVKLLSKDPVKRFLLAKNNEKLSFRVIHPGVQELAAA